MILTLTPNPSLDLLFSAERLVWEDANRIPMPRRRAGGQGINVVRAIRALRPEVDTLAVAPLGGPVGRELEQMLREEATPLAAVPIGGHTRVFVGVKEAESGRSLLLNPIGPAAGPDDAAAILETLDRALDAAGGAAWLACCGSLLPGLPADFYAEAGRRARRRGVRFVPDCDGPALAAAAEVADLLVPNELEAGRLVGRPVNGPEAAAAAGRALIRGAPDRVVVTLGRRGAVSVADSGAWWAHLRPTPELAREMAGASAVGAGDALLAALLLADGEQGPETGALVAAVAAGSAVLLSRGSQLITAGDVERLMPHVALDRLE